MNRTISLLSVVLLVQIALSIALFSIGNDTQAFATDEKLIGLDFASVDRIRIEDGEKKSVSMKKQDDVWILPELYDFPASAEKLDRVMNRLLKTTKGWPVATTPGAAKRFKVAADDFERRIDFDKGDQTLKALFIGTSPSFKKVHARISGQDDVYAIDFSAFEASTKPGDWSDKNFLKLNENDITQAKLPSFAIQRQKKEVVVSGLGQDEISAGDAITDLLRKLAGLSLQSVLGTEDKPEYKLDKPVFQYTLTLKEGEPVTYRFGQQEGQKDFVLKTSAHPYFFTVNAFTMDSIKNTTRDQLVRKKEEKEEAPTPADADQTEPVGAANKDTGKAVSPAGDKR